MPKNTKNSKPTTKNSSPTLDDILGTTTPTTTTPTPTPTPTPTNTDSNNKINKDSKTKTAIDQSNTQSTAQSTNQDINTNIDYILNNGTVKFDNKLQSSMFFVDYKSINIFVNTLKTKYNISISKEIIDDHIINQIPAIIKEYTCNLKKRCKKIINNEYICLGRKLDTKQCSRKKHNGTDFCKSHLIKLSNGRIDEPTQAIIRNKRGRKRKVEFDPRQYDNEYITLWEDIINGQKILLDGNNNMYTYDLEAPQYIGKKYIDTKIDLSIYKKKEKEKENHTKEKEKEKEKDNNNKKIKEVKPIIEVIEAIIEEVKPIIETKKIELNNTIMSDKKLKLKLKKERI